MSGSASHDATSLQGLAHTIAARVCRVRLSGVEAEWLRAIGIFEGQTVTVIRRAAFGGPLHVRTGSGGEFALDRSIAAEIDVEHVT